MKKLPKITVCRHRDMPSFRWFVNGRARYRLIKNSKNIETERTQLGVELLNGTTKKVVEQQHQKTLADHIEDFYQDLLTVAAPKQAGTVRKRVESIVNEAKIKILADITVARVRTAINRLRCAVRNPKKKPEDYPLLSERSRHHYARAIKQFTRWLDYEERYKNPLRKWRLKKVVVERCPRDRLQPRELTLLVRTTYASPRIIEGFTGQERAWLYLLASMTGLRRGELAALEPSSFNLTTRTVTVPAAYTKAKVRAIQPINRSMIPDLRKWLAPIRGPLFPGLRDKRTRKMIKLDLEAAGLPFKTAVGSRCFHALRNTYISQLFDAGLTINQVQRCARHTDIRLTTKYDKPRADEASLVDDLNYPGLT
jgi:integrase